MRRYFAIVLLITLCSCSKGGGVPTQVNLASDNVFTISDSSQLIGGPLAQGRIGDILLKNDKISVIIQQPTKYPASCPFGGVIIDADINREEGQEGQDNFGKMCPMVNVEWTVNYHDFQVIADGSDGGPKKVRALGRIDVLDYLDLDFIGPVAKALTDQPIYYSPRYDDANDPFSTYDDLSGVKIDVATDYTLEPGANYVRIETTFENNGDKPAVFPVGAFVNGSGQLQLLLPGQGFTPPPTAQITGDTTSIIYVPFPGVDVSYGYFYDLHQFVTEEPSATKAQAVMTGGADTAMEERRLISSSLTYSGVTGVLLGEEFLKLLPLGGPSEVDIHFSVPSHGTRTVTEYFVVGNGNAASVFDSGLSALGIPTGRISGKVVDEDGAGVAGATVVIQNEVNTTVIVYRTGSNGSFSGNLSRGGDSFAGAFGSGSYKIFVEKPGYHKEGTSVAGTCTPSSVKVTVSDVNNISCVLGSSGVVELKGGVIDADTGKKIPARLTIVGFDPSSDSHAGAGYATTSGSGNFEDTWIFERPWGIVDLKYVNAKGSFGLADGPSFRLEPGHYALVFSHGIEYGTDVREMDIAAGGRVRIDNVVLQRVLKTPGFISADFHLHAMPSPDSSISLERRVLAAAAEGMDVLQSSDHDWLTDYAPVVKKLEGMGIIPAGSLTTYVGDEISPNHYGHMNIFPLVHDSSKLGGGALDWTYSPFDSDDPSPDFVMSPRDIVDYFKTGAGSDGEKVLQVNHISDRSTALPVVSSWVTSTAYMDKFPGVTPLSSFVEPAAQRIKPKMTTPSIPLPFGTDDLVIADFTSVELAIGPELYTNKLRETGLPQWFNLLNLGILATGTADSDSHREIVDQIGMPRNYIAADSESLNPDDYAHAINEHRLVVSAGPFVNIRAKGEDGSTANLGEVVKGKKVVFHIDIQSPSWAWFDTVEIYANTEPLPADDDGVSVMTGIASDPKAFFAPYHVPKFYYEPTEIFTTADDTLPNWKEANGLITASLDVSLTVDEDTWVVVYVAGTPGTKGFRSLFPLVTKSVEDPSKALKIEDGWTLEQLIHNPAMNTGAWAFTNPIFIDVDGDTNGDGNPFEAKYIRNGISPLSH